MSTVKETLRVLGVLVGILSLVSFTQAMFSVGLVPVLEEFISFYRGVASYIFRLIGFIPPQSVLDFWTLSFLGASAYFKTQGIEHSRALRGLNLNPQSPWWRIGLLLILGFSGLGLLVVLSAVHPVTYIDGFHEEPQDLMKGAARNVFLICGGAILFFIFNAYGPSR
jgi:hypothetical protein